MPFRSVPPELKATLNPNTLFKLFSQPGSEPALPGPSRNSLECL